MSVGPKSFRHYTYGDIILLPSFILHGLSRLIKTLFKSSMEDKWRSIFFFSSSLRRRRSFSVPAWSDFPPFELAFPIPAFLVNFTPFDPAFPIDFPPFEPAFPIPFPPLPIVITPLSFSLALSGRGTLAPSSPSKFPFRSAFTSPFTSQGSVVPLK